MKSRSEQKKHGIMDKAEGMQTKEQKLEAVDIVSNIADRNAGAMQYHAPNECKQLAEH